ncbi:hypothetical protein SS50377_28186 [Spironucleus salmonicida]|uniref:Uncharacterized protein n=1 Tax=Spironucleus salmonicida TaxID=348837 RepID=V6LP39_9EUKA|nr:hypothetical protein SS50377_28186 [Spironucleus salmonicida]|eukprot:EST46370.1 Hypothetical protein SS50377_13613 [Spironucleus salmonicida]
MTELKESLRLNNNRTFSPILRVINNSYQIKNKNKFMRSSSLSKQIENLNMKVQSPLKQISNLKQTFQVIESNPQLTRKQTKYLELEANKIFIEAQIEKQRAALELVAAILNLLLPIEPENKNEQFSDLMVMVQKARITQQFIQSLQEFFIEFKRKNHKIDESNLNQFYYKNQLSKGKSILVNTDFITYQTSIDFFNDKLKDKRKHIIKTNAFYNQHVIMK